MNSIFNYLDAAIWQEPPSPDFLLVLFGLVVFCAAVLTITSWL